MTGDLVEIRGDLLNLHRIVTLRRYELGQETLLNLLLRNYLRYNLYDQAEKLRSKAPRFEAHSNQQFCRYLFYLGKIRTIQLGSTLMRKRACCKLLVKLLLEPLASESNATNGLL